MYNVYGKVDIKHYTCIKIFLMYTENVDIKKINFKKCCVIFLKNNMYKNKYFHMQIKKSTWKTKENNTNNTQKT